SLVILHPSLRIYRASQRGKQYVSSSSAGGPPSIPQLLLLPGLQLDVVVIDGAAVIVVVGIAKHEEVWNSRTRRIHRVQRYRPDIRLLSAPLEVAGSRQHIGTVIALDAGGIPGIVLVRVHSANCARGLKRPIGPGQKRTACAV